MRVRCTSRAEAIKVANKLKNEGAIVEIKKQMENNWVVIVTSDGNSLFV